MVNGPGAAGLPLTTAMRAPAGSDGGAGPHLSSVFCAFATAVLDTMSTAAANRITRVGKIAARYFVVFFRGSSAALT